MLTLLQTIPIELNLLMLMLICGMSSLLLFRAFGLLGLYCYIAVAVIAANIQVLTATKLLFFSEPIAQGTIVFTSLFMVVNIIAEHYGREAARKAIWISFSALLLLIALMMITISWPELNHANYQHFDRAKDAISVIFTPAPSLLISSLIAYGVSQYNDIWIYSLCRKVTNDRFLWLRANLATMFSGLVDNTLFSILAWWVFAVEPLSFSTILYSYILGTYLMRVGLSVLNTPFIYLSYYFKPRNESSLAYV